jgi:hypothetical protein
MGATESTPAPKAEPLVDKEKKPTEATPLVAGDEDLSPEEAAKKRLYTTLSIVFMISVAVTKTQLTAFLFSSSSYPTAYSLYSCIVTCVMIIPFFVFNPAKYWRLPTKQMLSGEMSMIILFTTLDLGMTNVALSQIPTALQACIAATNPFWTVWIESLVYKRMAHWLVYVIVSCITCGAVFVSLGAVDRATVVGVSAAIIGVLCSANKTIFVHKAFKVYQKDLGPLALLFWIDTFMVPIFFVWLGIAYAAGNHEIVDMSEETFTSTSVFWQMTGTAALGGVRALSQYILLVFISATSMSVTNVFTQVLNILVAIPIQHTTVTPFLGAGVSIVCTFAPSYAFIKMNKGVLKSVDDALPCCSTAKSS